MATTLDLVQANERGRVIKVVGESRIKQRMFDMGITPGAVFVFIKKAPMGDPIEIKIRGYQLTLRKDEAKTVVVEVEEGE